MAMTYKKAGVNVSLGNLCSQKAYDFAKKTFASRARSKIGRPVRLDGGFTGFLDMGDFFLTQNEDGVGTKMMVAEMLGKYDTLGRDLCAMVADDAVCNGAEVISITNTIDARELSRKVISSLMRGLSNACREQKISIVGGEIAELPGMVSGYSWNATAVGVIAKEKIILGRDIKAGDIVCGIFSPNFRSNGFSLVRHILKKRFGNGAWGRGAWGRGAWGRAVLQPSVIYHDAVLSLHGRFGEKSRVKLKGIAHITGGGLPGNALRMLPTASGKKLGMIFDNLFDPPQMMTEIQKLGNVADREAYETWNMGVGMLFVCDDPEKATALLVRKGLRAQPIGRVTRECGVKLLSRGAYKKGKMLQWE